MSTSNNISIRNVLYQRAFLVYIIYAYYIQNITESTTLYILLNKQKVDKCRLLALLKKHLTLHSNIYLRLAIYLHIDSRLASGYFHSLKNSHFQQKLFPYAKYFLT